MPVDYSQPTQVDVKTASKVRLTQMRLRLQRDNHDENSVVFSFTAYDAEGKEVESKSVRKSLTEILGSHAAEFASAHAAIKKVAYDLMVSESTFPAGTVS